MSYADTDLELKLKVGEYPVSVIYRRPDPGRIIETMVRKIPRGAEDEDALRMLNANFDLGRECVKGIGEGRAVLVEGESGDGDDPPWPEFLAERFPLILIALGQYLSAVPAYVTDGASKKN